MLKEKGAKIKNVFPGAGRKVVVPPGTAKENKVGEDVDFGARSRRANGV